MMTRPLYSRTDLEMLKTLTRDQVLDAFGSFEAVDDESLVKNIEQILDAKVLETRASDDLALSVFEACKSDAVMDASQVDEETLRLAEDVLEHRFKFYTETHQLPQDIDWDYNPGTAHWGHDLNRFSYLSLLTRAYFATQDERFGRKAIALILDWIDKCDIGKCFQATPYVFGSYLNNAIHCAGWAHCVQMLLPSGLVKPVELLRILKSLHDQMAYLEVVTNGHGGNWPTIGCQGILQVLAVFPIFRDTNRWVDYCVDTLARQIEDQILPDGVQDELTPHYHAVVVNNLLTACESLHKLNRTLRPDTMDTLRQMVRYQQQTIMPNRSAQLAFNDSDPESVPNVQHRLEALGLSDYLLPPEQLGPEVFPYAGVAFLRQRASAGDLYLAFDGGPYGRGHQHEDKLGFWLYAFGRNFIVDPGRHLYDHSEVSYLDFLKSTHSHSTLTINGENQNSRAHPETWIAKEPVSLNFSQSDGVLRASARYDLGYGADNAIDVMHRREIVFVDDRFWIVFDRIEGNGEHVVASRFQYYPGDLAVEGNQVTTQYPDANLLLWAHGEWDTITVHKGDENPRQGWYSASYSRIEPAPCLVLSKKTALPFVCATLLYPYQQTPELLFDFDGEVALVTLANGEKREITHTLI